jgi:hypothetical protein
LLAVVLICGGGFFLVRMSGQRGYAIGGGMGGRDEWTLVNADGIPAGKYGEVYDGENKRLLTILFVAPGAEGQRSQSWDSGSRVAVFDVPMGYGEKRVEMGATWDKVDDVVMIEGRKYDRRNGSLFVVVKPLGGTVDVWQLSYTPEGLPLDKVVLRHVKAELPYVDAVQAIEMP